MIWVWNADPRPHNAPPPRVRKRSNPPSLCPDLQLLLHALVLLGLGETLLLIAVVVDVADVQVGTVRAVVLLAVAVVVQEVVRGGRRGRRGRHHHVQLILGLLEILLGFLCLVRSGVTE